MQTFYSIWRVSRWSITLLALILGFACSQPAKEQAAEPQTAPTEASTDASAADSRTAEIQKSTASIDQARIVAAEPGNWLSNGRTYDEQRHSPLTAINRDNVKLSL